MQEDTLKAILLLADVGWTSLYPIENGYVGNSSEYGQNNPWWLVRTVHGLIKIGWRKRVINIDWSDTPYRGSVTDHDVTQEDTYVHAYGYARAVEYLSVLDLKLKQQAYQAQSAGEVADVMAETGQG